MDETAPRTGNGPGKPADQDEPAPHAAVTGDAPAETVPIEPVDAEAEADDAQDEWMPL